MPPGECDHPTRDVCLIFAKRDLAFAQHLTEFDNDGLGMEPNNLTAINSLKGYRALRYGQHLDMIITDQHSYRSVNPFSDPSLEQLGGDEFMGMFPESAMQILDGGRGFSGGNPPTCC